MIFVVLAMAMTAFSSFPYSTLPESASIRTAAVAYRGRSSWAYSGICGQIARQQAAKMPHIIFLIRIIIRKSHPMGFLNNI